MTVTVPDTGEIISHADVRESVAVARSHGEKFFEQIVWQVENEVWTVLGYKSWDEMREAEYGDLGVVAPRADRPELVSRLRARGLPNTAIADTLGVTEGTVRNVIRNSAIDAPSEPVTNSRGQRRPAAYQRREPEPEVIDAEIVDETPPDPAVSKDLALINDLRGPWANGITNYARKMPPERRALIIAALQDVLNTLTNMEDK